MNKAAPLSTLRTICVCGAGTMGSGIAQQAAMCGFYTLLFDLNTTVLKKADESINANLELLLSKQKISVDEKNQTIERIKFTNNINDCLADIIIEAIVEKLDIKATLFQQLEAINSTETIFASNTSSLSISEIQKHISKPERLAGMHFFNPATLMKLVEVVRGELTDELVVEKMYQLCLQLKKVPVICKDAPGFIVNRVARHYYLEAFKLVEQGIANFETVDNLMVATGFKMGPFRLMDLIGNDINLAVTQSLYDAFNKEERFAPSEIQKEKVRLGELGKKTGKGYYDYAT